VKQAAYTDALLNYWVLHSVLPLFFTLNGRYDFLHAGAIEIKKEAVLFLAPSYGGKSTMTAFCLGSTAQLISDDKVALYEENSAFYAVASYPYHRPYRKSEDLGIAVQTTVKQPKPVKAIYELRRSDAQSRVAIVELFGVEKFKALRLNSEINFSFLKPKRLEFLAHLAKHVRVYQISVPWDKTRLKEVCSAIINHRRS